MAFMNYENKKGSGKKLKVHFDLPGDDDYPNQKYSSSSSSPRSSLDSDDSHKEDNGMDSVDSKYGFCGSPVWTLQEGSFTQSPPVQLMDSPSYDPNRIPSSIFSNKPTNPMEWSVASNESLFSLQLNNSFSRDQAFTFSKSGDLPSTPTTPLSPVEEVTARGKNENMGRNSLSSSQSEDSYKGHHHEITARESAVSVGDVVELKKTEPTSSAQVGTNGIVLDKTPKDHDKEAKVSNGEFKKYSSMERDMSTRSFQFPILTAEGARTSSSTVESEKQQTIEKQEQQPEKPLKTPSPKTEKAPKQSGKSWCFCFSCSCF